MDDVIDTVIGAAESDDGMKVARELAAASEAEIRRRAAEQAVLRKAANRRADLKVLSRAAIFVAYMAAMIVTGRAGMVDFRLWGILLMVGCYWIGCHFGAWRQFRARKEDKLYG